MSLGRAGDPTHPLEDAEKVAGLLPQAQLVVSDVPWPWGARDRLREVVGEFLNPVVG